MLSYLMNLETLIFYILAGELLFLILLQFRTNGLLKKTLKIRTQKKEQIRQLKEEVKKGTSEIPVVKFEKQRKKENEVEKSLKKSGYDPKEMAVLQEMMTEFFG